MAAVLVANLSARAVVGALLVGLSVGGCARPASQGADQGDGQSGEPGTDRSAVQRPYNVLFIAIDDLRPELGAYGETHMVTPNLDRLAAEGRMFRNHFVQAPTCGASRFSLLTGIRPRSSDHLSNDAFVRLLPREEAERPESVAHLFRRNGYYTAAVGKVSHYPDGRVYTYQGEGDGRPEMPFSWDESTGPADKWGTAWNAFFGYADGSNRNQARGVAPAFESADVSDSDYPDGLIAATAVEKLAELRDRPFFLAVGFHKPHLPFTAPQRYWDLYDADAIELSENPDAPTDTHAAAVHDSNEMFGNYGHPVERGAAGERLDDAYARTLRHAYFAAVSYVDAQVGTVIDALERYELAGDTVVVVWGDHGWHLGDHTIWGKHSTFERALRSVLIVRVPEIPDPGTPADGLVESLDLYPTLAEIAGLSAPAGLDGVSLVPLLDDPHHPGKDGAFGYWQGRRTLRTQRFRLTLYDEGEPAVELFDHRTDLGETTNVADAYPEVVARLLPQLRANRPEMIR